MPTLNAPNGATTYYDRISTSLFPGQSTASSPAAMMDDDRIGGAHSSSQHDYLYNHLKGCYAEHCAYLLPMAGWFLFSALISSYNKFVFGSDHLNFPCPLVLTSIHFSCQWIFSWSMCKLFPDYFGSKRIDDMTWSEFLGISLPCGLVTSGDVGLSNLSLVTISITFYTMIKASTPVFVLIWGYFFGIVRITWTLCGVVLIIAIGEFLTVAGEVEFKFTGFILCLMASLLSGARWTLVQLKIQALDPPLKTTVATMRVLSPFMFLSMLIVACALEQPWNSLREVIDSWETFFYVVALGLLGACFAICMIMCEFWLIMHTSAIILMIGGVIKEMLTIFIGVFFFRDPLNWINFGGCVVVLCGVVLYKVTFHLDKEKARVKAATAIEKDPENTINDEKRERQPLRHAKDGDDSNDDGNDDDVLIDDANGYSDSSESSMEIRRSINGQYDGIEMRRSTTRKRGSSGGGSGSDKEENKEDNLVKAPIV